MNSEQKGCIRFKWGRDFNLRDFTTEALAMKLDNEHKIDYTKMLKSKHELFTHLKQKDAQVQVL